MASGKSFPTAESDVMWAPMVELVQFKPTGVRGSPILCCIRLTLSLARDIEDPIDENLQVPPPSQSLIH